MKFTCRLLSFALATVLLSTLFATQGMAKQNNANVLLAQVYKRGIGVRQYLVSEKYDGVRAV
jgi:DNA ligase-1